MWNWKPCSLTLACLLSGFLVTVELWNWIPQTQLNADVNEIRRRRQNVLLGFLCHLHCISGIRNISLKPLRNGTVDGTEIVKLVKSIQGVTELQCPGAWKPQFGDTSCLVTSDALCVRQPFSETHAEIRTLGVLFQIQSSNKIDI